MSVQMIPQPWNLGPEEVQVKQIIITQLKSAGDGTQDSPYRRVTQFWDMEGNCIASFDNYSVAPKVTMTTTQGNDLRLDGPESKAKA